MSQSGMVLEGGHGGAREASPFAVDSKKLIMWLFLIADAATFGALLFAYGYLRVGNPEWSRPFAFYPSILNGMIMTAVLLTSSLTMLIAVTAAQSGNRKQSLRWLGATAFLGIVFAVLHLREWFSMFAEGWSPSRNPLGGPVLFGGTFFGITGLHLLHVISGVIAIAIVGIRFGRGRMQTGHIETTGLYWHFVDLVWMFVFPLLYLLNIR